MNLRNLSLVGLLLGCSNNTPEIRVSQDGENLANKGDLVVCIRSEIRGPTLRTTNLIAMPTPSQNYFLKGSFYGHDMTCNVYGEQ